MAAFIKKADHEFIIAALGFLLIVVLLWAPFGIKTTDFADGWINLLRAGSENLTSLVEGPRPLVMLPWKLAAALSPDSFAGVVLLLAALFWGKALVFYSLVRKLRLAPPALSFLIALLFILYPADQGNFLMRALGRHTAVFFYFLAVLLLVLASRRFTPLSIAAMLAAEGMTAFMSEQGYPLLLVTPAILLMEKETSPARKRILALAWYSVLLAAVVNFLAAEKIHQEKIFESGLTGSMAEYLKEIVLSLLVAYRRIFVDGWLRAFTRWEDLQGQFVLAALAVLLIAALTIYLLSRSQPAVETHPDTEYRLPVVLLAGLALIGLSFFPYSLTGFRYEASRVFYYAAAGGALVVGLLASRAAAYLPRWRNSVLLLFRVVVLFIISVNGLGQQATLANRSQIQQQVLVDIVEQAPSLKPNTAVVLLTDRLFFTQLDYVFGAAVNWMYDRGDLQGILCINSDPCSFPFARAVIFEYTEEQGTRLLESVPAELRGQAGAEDYAPYRRIIYSDLSRRALTGLEVKPDPARVAPQDWTGEGQTLADRRVCNSAYSGVCSLLISSRDGPPTTFSREVQAAGAAHDSFEFSLMGRSGNPFNTSIPAATVVVFHQDGTREEFVLSAQFDRDWTLHLLAFEPRKPYTSLLLELHPNAPSRNVWLDDVHLTRDGSVIPISNNSFEK